MLKGLEIIEVNLSKAIENKDLRIDSDFWTKEPRKNSKLKYEKIGALLKKSQYGISISMNGDKIGYPIYRMNEIHNMMCDLNVDKYADISKDEFEKFKLNDRDVLFNRTNSYEWVGRTGIYRKTNEQEFIFASYLVRFVPDEKIINPEYLIAYLNTKYGEREIKRRARRSINQTNVNPEEVKEIYIPLLCKKIQNFIKNVFSKAHAYRLKSDDMINSAKTLLLETIGLKNFTPNAKAICVKNFKNSYHQTGRLDAEYYQCKYENLLTHITACPHSKLLDLVSIQKSIEPGSDAYTNDENGIPFLRVADYDKFNINKPQKKLGTSFVSKNCLKLKTLKPKKETILFSKDGSIGQAYCLRRDADFITSGAILHLRIKDHAKLLPDYLTLVLNSKIVQMQAERDAGGSIIVHWRVSEIKNTVIPLVDLNTQSQISSLIQESFALKAESERLLNVAKQAVEMAIEQDEESATKWIQEQLKVDQ